MSSIFQANNLADMLLQQSQAQILTNSGGGVYILGPGDVTLKSSASGATYRNTSGGTLINGVPLSVTVAADVAGAGGTVAAGGIDTLVTTLLGVTCTNPIAAVGLNAQDAPTTIQQCRNKLGSLSPNGPAAGYAYVALNQLLTGIQTVTRVRAYPSSQNGAFPVYIAGPSAGISPGDVAAVQSAINTWSAPLCFTPTVIAANPVTVPVTYSLWLYSSVGQTTAQIQTAVAAALGLYFAARPIGGDIIPPATTGTLYADEIKALIGRVFPNDTFRVTVSLPAGDVALGNGDVPVLGTVTPTINIISGP